MYIRSKKCAGKALNSLYINLFHHMSLKKYCKKITLMLSIVKLRMCFFIKELDLRKTPSIMDLTQKICHRKSDKKF